MSMLKEVWSAIIKILTFLKRINTLETRVADLEDFLKGELPKDACPKCKKRDFVVVSSCSITRGGNVVSGIQRDFECSSCQYTETVTEFFKKP